MDLIKKPEFFLFLKIFIATICIIIVFIIGMSFEKIGGLDKYAPIVINFIRKKFLGDKIVLNMEKKIFSLNDFLKQAYHNYPKNIFENNNNHGINDHVVKTTEAYYKNHTSFHNNDYKQLSLLVQNFYQNIPSIYSKPIKNEGVWEKFFISSETFRPLYAKTFIRPDLKRSYVKVFIYKFDMDRLSLEFIPGKEDCTNDECNGGMTKNQKKRVLWMFSGGYQYVHGKYGMKYQGKIILPPKPGAATLLMNTDGSYNIIEWPKDMTDDNTCRTFRQNEKLLIINSKISPYINKLWGYTPKNVDPIYTVRSGLGFTKNNELVFAFGEDLSAKSLAIAMIKAGVITGMHLDMNYYNVHFVNVERTASGKLKTHSENEVLSYYKNIYSVYSNRDYFIIAEK